MSETGLTHVLASKAAGLDYDNLPPPARELVRQCVLDYLGVAVAGASDGLVRLLLDEMNEAGGAPKASVIGHELRLPALSAALVNGAAAHALDYDDVNMAMPGHPSVAILPALLALAELRHSSGHAVATAFVAGYETTCRIGGALQSRLSFDRHDRQLRGRGGVRSAARPRRRDDRHRARHRRHAGGRAQIAVRHDVQAVPRRKGGSMRAAGGAPRGARLFEPYRYRRMRAGVRAHARPGFRARSCVGRARGRPPPFRQPLQISRCLLS